MDVTPYLPMTAASVTHLKPVDEGRIVHQITKTSFKKLTARHQPKSPYPY